MIMTKISTIQENVFLLSFEYFEADMVSQTMEQCQVVEGVQVTLDIVLSRGFREV